MKKLFTLFLVLAGCVSTVSAADDVYLRCNLNATQDNNWYSWDNDVDDYKFTWIENNGSEDVYSYIIDASEWIGNINFRLHKSTWGNTQQIPQYGNECIWSFSNTTRETYEIWAAGNDYKSDYYSNRYFTINHGAVGASKYKIMLYWRTSDNRIWMTVDIVSMPLTITNVGYATFSCDRNLRLYGTENFGAYIASAPANGKVAMTKVEGVDIPANTGLFVKGPAGTYEVPVISLNEIGAVLSGENYLCATNGGSVDAGNYVFASQDGDLGFYPLGEATVIEKGKAYLTGGAGARLSIVFDDTNSISSLKVANGENAYFDLQGRRVVQPAKGLYIVNGKKVIK